MTVTLRLGKPYKSSDVDWACPVALDGIYKRLADQHGIDSFKALMLAQSLLRQLMAEVIEDGGCFRLIEDDSVVDLEALFARGL
ncbi:MAG: hypothetical protein WAN11_13690 [Syntrophobacteraceae bacterium]